jgi:hypothetical protein
MGENIGVVRHLSGNRRRISVELSNARQTVSPKCNTLKIICLEWAIERTVMILSDFLYRKNCCKQAKYLSYLVRDEKFLGMLSNC